MQLFGPPDVTKLEAKKDLKGLIKALGYEKDWVTRKKAAKALGQIGDIQAAEALIAALEDRFICVEAATALGKIGDIRAVESLIPILKDMDPYARIAAADALGKLKDDRAVDPLITGLMDPEITVRKAFINALGLIGEPRAAEALKVLLKDESEYVRPVAANALDQIGWGADHGESSAWFWVHTKNWGKAAEFGNLAVEPLLFDLMNDYSRPNRHIERLDSYLIEWGEAAKTLVKIGDKAVEPLIVALNNADLRWYAIEVLKGLGKLNDPRVMQALLDNLVIVALHDVDLFWYVIKALKGLKKLGDPRVIQTIEIINKSGSVFTEEDEHWCTQVVNAIGKFGDPHTVPFLIPFLIKKGKYDQLLSMAAQDALVHIGDPAIKPLTSMLKDKSENMRKAAAAALAKFDDSLAKEALTPLRKKKVPQRSEGFKMDGQFAIYKLNQTCLGNPLVLIARTEKYCVYCMHLRDPNLHNPTYPKGAGECANYGSGKSVVSFDDTCEHWNPNTKVRFWLSKGYVEHNLDGWPKKPWYQLFDDGPDGEEGTR